MYLGIWYSQSRSRDSRGRRPGGIKLLGRGCQRLCMYEWGVETGDFILRNLGAMTFSSNWVTFQADSGVFFFFFWQYCIQSCSCFLKHAVVNVCIGSFADPLGP